MPDWSYRMMFRPLLFTLPARLARDITLQAMGTLSKMPWGSLVIRTLGHMESYPILGLIWLYPYLMQQHFPSKRS